MSLSISFIRRSCVVAALLVILSVSAGSISAHAAAVPATAIQMDTNVSWEQQVIGIVNAKRATKRGCQPLSMNPTLMSVARAHSEDMMNHNFFSHNGSNGSSPWDRMHKAGYQYSRAGENIAAGQPSPQSVVDAWMHSPPHRANIMNCKYIDIGVGLAYGGGAYGYYWTQDFGRPANLH